MRILKRNFKKDSEGYVVVVPTDEEDLWHLYNLIQKGDCIKMRTLRKISKVSNSTGLKDVEKKKLVLTLAIESIDYFAEQDFLTISLKGRNIVENDYLQIGQYHTFVIQLNEKVTIIKECWTSYEIGLLKELGSQVTDCEVAAIVMDEGIANICYVKNSMTLRKLKIEKNISRKAAGEQKYQKTLAKFFEECYKGVRTIDYSKIKCMIIASPGFVNEQFLKYVKEASGAETDKGFRKDLEKFVLVKTANGFISSLNEALNDPRVAEHIKDTKAYKQIKALERFDNMMKTNLNRIAYGQKDVFKCLKLQAIDTLLISDKLFRTKDLNKRKVYNRLVDDVRRKGGEVFIFSSLHQSGERLNNITGIAAILRFDVELEEDEGYEEPKDEEEEEKEEEEKFNRNLLKRVEEEMGEDKDDDDEFEM